ncbi:PREDICTED: importin subunit alpha-like [Trachymyrmex cornetzi]|uniref:importin subunit alpha-like n=1 Tax=Trachymyrmex cornetzi TaxID=471704 RepID=UPI00084ED110|nr:PREDICTED: importin subunit alpha-like [Trachymyrmex cornetzi]
MSVRGDQNNRSTTNFNVNNKSEELLRIKKDAIELCETISKDRLLKRNFGVQQELFDLMFKTSLPLDLSVLDKIANNINSSDETLQLMAIQTYRKLGRERNTVNDMIKGGIVSRCIKLLDSDNIYLQSEVTSLLTVITLSVSEESNNYIKYEAIPKLMKLLKSTSSIVAEQTVYVLGNIIDIPYARDLALQYDAISLLVDLIKSDTSVTFMDNISWLLSNLCEKNPPLCLELVRPVLPIFYHLLNSENDYIISDICRILSYLTDGVNDNVQAIMETGILPKILECLISRKGSISIPAFITIRNIVQIGNDAQRNAIISAGGLLYLRTILKHYGSKVDIAKEAIWTIYKMADSSDQIESVINANLLPVLIKQISHGETPGMAAWTVTTMITRGTVQQFTKFVEAGVLRALCFLLKFSDNNNDIINAIIGLTNVLHTAERIGLTITIQQLGELIDLEDKLIAFQYHEDEEIYKKSLAIIDWFFFRTHTELPSLSIEAVIPSTRTPSVPQDWVFEYDEALQVLALQVYSQFLSLAIKPATKPVLESKALSYCMEILDRGSPASQFEVLSLFTALIRGKFSKEMQCIIKHGAISKIVKLLKSASFNIAKCAIFTLEALIKGIPYARDIAIEHNAVLSLVDLIKSDIPTIQIVPTHMCYIIRTLTIFCKKMDSALFLELIRPVLPVLNCLLNNENRDLRTNIFELLSYHIDKSIDNIRAVLEAGILPKILKCLTSREESILMPVLHIVGNIVGIDEVAESDILILAEQLSYLRTLLRNHRANEHIAEKIVVIISKMITNPNQIQNVLNAGLLSPLIEILEFGKEMVQGVTGRILMDLILCGTSQYLIELVNAGILLAFCNLLEAKEYHKVINALDSLINILSAAGTREQTKRFVIMIKEAGGLDKLKALRYHQDEKIYEKSMAIIDIFFS